MQLTEIQKQLIRESFDQIRDIAAPLAGLFYGRLFLKDPTTRPLFRGDIKLQGSKLMDMLSAVVLSLDTFDTLAPTLRDLGHRHAVYGVQTSQYLSVSAALQWALSQALETQFDAETRAAWAALLDAVSAEMIAGAAEVRAPGA